MSVYNKCLFAPALAPPPRNEMERQYLECLQFDINVSSSVYAKYYFELRYLAEAHDLILPLKLLDKQRALRLEVTLTGRVLGKSTRPTNRSRLSLLPDSVEIKKTNSIAGIYYRHTIYVVISTAN